MKPKTKAIKEIQDYLITCSSHIKHFLDKDTNVWIEQVSNDIIYLVEKYYEPKKNKDKKQDD